NRRREPIWPHGPDPAALLAPPIASAGLSALILGSANNRRRGRPIDGINPCYSPCLRGQRTINTEVWMRLLPSKKARKDPNSPRHGRWIGGPRMLKKVGGPGDNGTAVLPAEVASGTEALSAERCLLIHRIMVRSRLMEERMIKMSKSGEGYFWIGGPGEEAFNACLGLLVKKGQGPAFDFLHLHYPNSTALLAMGMSLADGMRQMAMTATDPHSMGRNFAGHFARRDWNILPVTSVIEVQHAMAPGTAMVQKRYGGD